MSDRLCLDVATIMQDGGVLCELGVEARISARAAPVEIHSFLVRSLTEERANTAPPDFLAMRIENIYEEDGALFFVDARMAWSTADLNLAPCIAEPGAADDVLYKLRGFVAHQHGAGPTENGMRGGHYVAYL